MMMKYLKHQKNKALVGALFLFSAGWAHGQTDVKVTLLNNTEQVYSVEASGKLWFSNSNLIINANDVAAQITIPLSDIRIITFDDNTTTGISETIKNKETVSIFPNPASDYFDIIASNSTKLNVRIFNTNGAQVASGIYESGKRVDVSRLSAGIYVVVVNNQSFKLIKQ